MRELFRIRGRMKAASSGRWVVAISHSPCELECGAKIAELGRFAGREILASE